MKKISGAIIIYLILCPSILPGAQAKKGSQMEEILRSEEFLFGDEPVVTSAARREQPLHEAPFALTVFTGTDLKLFGIHSLGDIFRLVPGMDVSLITPGFTYFNVRGFATEKNVRTLVLIDGRIANIDALGPSIIESFPLSIDEIERIEVIRGGGSSLYGANAFSGIISIITRNPEKTPPAWGFLSGGTQPDNLDVKPLGTSTAAVGSGYWMKGVGGYRVSLGYRQGNDWRVPEDIGHRVTWGRVLLGTDAVRHLRLSLEGGGTYITSTVFASFANLPYTGREYFTQLKGEYKDLTFNGYYKAIHIDASLFIPLINTPMSLTGDTGIYTADIQYSLPIGKYFHVIPGVNARYMFYDIKGFQKKLRDISLDREFMAGGFLHCEANPLSDLSIVLDARYDWFSVTEPALSPRLAASYTMTEGHILRAAAGQSFRKPTWLEAQALSENPFFKALKFPGNPDVHNELVRTAELGYRGYPVKKLRVEGEVFYDQYTNFIFFQLITAPTTTFRNENVKVLLWSIGGEMELGYTPFSWLKMDGSYSFIYKKDYVTGAVEKIPQQKATASLQFRPEGYPFVGLMGQYVQSFKYEITDPVTFSNNIQWIPSYVLVNAALGYAFLKGRIETGLHVFNLFNHRHRESAYMDSPIGYVGAEEVGQKVALFVRANI